MLAKRRMYRHFSTAPVDQLAMDRILNAATKGPSAGYTQGFDFLVITEGIQRDKFWSLATTMEWRSKTKSHKGLTNAPILIIPLANPEAYLQRYSEQDKNYSRLNTIDNWPIPYWYIDCSFATMLILEAVVNEGLGALFFGLFRNTEKLKESFLIPPCYQPIGAIAIGHPTSDIPSKSAKRGKRDKSTQFHFNTFTSQLPLSE